jgi:hypothetical protein
LRGAAAFKLCQVGQQRVATMKLVASEGDEHDDAGIMAVAGKVGEQIKRRWIGPVGVLDYQQEPTAPCQPPQQVEQCFEQPRLRRIAARSPRSTEPVL